MKTESRRTSFSDLLSSMKPVDDAYHVEVTPDWKQGRAVYGGLTVALCVDAAKKTFSELPALRSVQTTFIAPPTSSTLVVQASKVREGRSATFIDVTVTSEDAPVARVSLVFGAARPSAFSKHWHPAPDFPAREDCPPFFELGLAPSFAQHFNSRFAGGQIPVSGADTGDIGAWLQHKDEPSRTTLEGLMCLADGLPPAAMTLMDTFAPVSSVTWMFDIVGDLENSDDGWWLLRSTCDAVGEGYSSQHMGIWNGAGEPVIIGRQNCVIFA